MKNRAVDAKPWGIATDSSVEVSDMIFFIRGKNWKVFFGKNCHMNCQFGIIA